MADRIDRTLDKLENEDEILRVFNELHAQSSDAIADRLSATKRHYQMFDGKQWLKKAESGEWDEDENSAERVRVQRDILSEVVETLRSIHLRGQPRYIVEADYPSLAAVARPSPKSVSFDGSTTDGELAQRFTELYEGILAMRGETVEVSKMLVDVLVAGIAHRKVIPDRNTGLVVAPLLSHEQVLPDPSGTRIDYTDHSYLILMHEMDWWDIERVTGLKESDYVETARPRPFDRLRRKSQDTGYRRRYPVYELWYMGAPEGELHLESKEPKGLKYPRGRKFLIVNGTKLAHKGANPFWHGRFPVVSYQAYPMPNRYWPRTDFTQLVDVQAEINIIHSLVIQNWLLSSNPQWLVEDGALMNTPNNRPGAIVKTAPGKVGAVQRQPGLPIQGDAFAVARSLEQFGRDHIGGIGDALAGREPSTQSSGILAQTLQQAGLTRQTAKMLSLDESYHRQARLETATLQQFADVGNPALHLRNDFGERLAWDEALRDLFYDVKVESKAEMPHNVEQRIQFAVALLQLGVWDMEEFMEFTRLQVRPELRQKIRNSSDSFVPGLPHEMQAQMALQAAAQGGRAPVQEGTQL